MLAVISVPLVGCLVVNVAILLRRVVMTRLFVGGLMRRAVVTRHCEQSFGTDEMLVVDSESSPWLKA